MKNGHDYKGTQKYACRECGSYGTWTGPKGHSQILKEQVKRAVQERVSLRGISRIFRLSRQTVAHWLEQWQPNDSEFQASLAPAQVDDILELDEQWSFVGSKAYPYWLWVAQCRRTRQIVAYWLGDRSEMGALQLWRRLPDGYRRCYSFSDHWQAYTHIFDYTRHSQVDKKTGQTAHVERFFNTLRQRSPRLTRQTLAFSKSCFFHEIVLRLFLLEYNRACIS